MLTDQEVEGYRWHGYLFPIPALSSAELTVCNDGLGRFEHWLETPLTEAGRKWRSAGRGRNKSRPDATRRRRRALRPRGRRGDGAACGSFSLHHTLARHRSAPNRASHRRIGLGISYIPAHVRTIGSYRPSALLASAGMTAAAISICPRRRRASSIPPRSSATSRPIAAGVGITPSRPSGTPTVSRRPRLFFDARPSGHAQG
jgi:hypothetical protein